MSHTVEPRLADCMTVALAREIRDGDFVSQGTNAPLSAAALALARRLHAPGAECFLAGFVSPQDLDVTLMLLEPERMNERAPAVLAHGPLIDLILRGRASLQLLRPLQIDQLGNVNTSVIGPLDRPRLRTHGLATADSLSCFERVGYYVTEHSTRVFSEQLWFLTGLGHQQAGRWRAELDLPGHGPSVCVTPLGVFDFDGLGRTMRLRSLFPGVAVQDVIDGTGFDLAIPDDVSDFAVGDDELAALEEVDPLGVRRLDFRDLRGTARAEIAAGRARLDRAR